MLTAFNDVKVGERVRTDLGLGLGGPTARKPAGSVADGRQGMGARELPCQLQPCSRALSTPTYLR